MADPSICKLFEPDYDLWTPTEDQLIALATPGLRTRDKVELVMAFYAEAVGGPYPVASEIARILGISKKRVEQAWIELIAQGRAKRQYGRLRLRDGQYTNPTVSAVLKKMGFD